MRKRGGPHWESQIPQESTTERNEGLFGGGLGSRVYKVQGLGFRV